MDELIEVLGEVQTFRLLARIPERGKRKWRRVLYIPKRAIPDDHFLVRALSPIDPRTGRADVETGRADAKKLQSAFRGMNLQVSNLRFVFREYVALRVVRDAEQGMEFGEIAREHGLSTDRVREILDANKPIKKKPRLPGLQWSERLKCWVSDPDLL